jgi:hypothetical protein
MARAMESQHTTPRWCRGATGRSKFFPLFENFERTHALWHVPSNVIVHHTLLETQTPTETLDARWANEKGKNTIWKQQIEAVNKIVPPQKDPFNRALYNKSKATAKIFVDIPACDELFSTR